MARISPCGPRATTGELTGGFRLLSEGLVVLTEDEALGFRPERRRRKEAQPLQDLTSLADLAEGDCVVHLDHGIGLYRLPVVVLPHDMTAVVVVPELPVVLPDVRVRRVALQVPF